MHVKRNAEARSCNHGNGKTVSITYYQRVFVALVIQHGMRMCHIIICGPLDFKFFLIIS